VRAITRTRQASCRRGEREMRADETGGAEDEDVGPFIGLRPPDHRSRAGARARGTVADASSNPAITSRPAPAVNGSCPRRRV
jgi:hypothetical protein